VPNYFEIALTEAEICKFQYYASLAWKFQETWPNLFPLSHTHTVGGLGHISPKWCHSSS